MCGHFALDYRRHAEVVETFSIDEMETSDFFDPSRGFTHYYPSRGAASVQIPAIFQNAGKRTLMPLRWDLVPHWWKKTLAEKRMASFNARADSLGQKPTFKAPWLKGQRCIVPAHCFFEWADRPEPGREKRREYRVELEGQPLLGMAGLWDICSLPSLDVPLRSCAILTTQANAAIARIPHDRMPVILSQEQVPLWLDPSLTPADAQALIGTYNSDPLVVEAA